MQVVGIIIPSIVNIHNSLSSRMGQLVVLLKSKNKTIFISGYILIGDFKFFGSHYGHVTMAAYGGNRIRSHYQDII